VLDEGEEMHSVVMHAGLPALGAGVVAGIGAAAGAVGDRIAPGVEQADDMAGGDADFVGGRYGQRDDVTQGAGGTADAGRQGR